MRVSAVGWTPTDGGLVVDLNQGDQFLLSVMVGDKEYFVNNYNRYTGGDFNYSAGSFLKLIPHPAGSEPSEMAVWTVGAPLERGKYSLGGIVYTIWNDGKTLKVQKEKFKFFGDLTDNYEDDDACDVVFVIPTNRVGIVSFDPNRTLGRGETATTADAAGVIPKGRFNGATGYNAQLDLNYREVYMMEIPKSNDPRAYTNAALVTFNTTKSNKTWAGNTVQPGIAAYAYADDKHKPTTRTIFRLYLLNDKINSCSSYFFATDVQNKAKKYRQSNTMTDSTQLKKIYTWDRLFCMEQVEDTSIFKSNWMPVPAEDSTFYYVGKNNTYVNDGNKATMKLNQAGTAVSQFKNISSLRVDGLKNNTWGEGKPFIAPKGAYGRMVVDTTSEEQNIGVTFEPKEYFLKVNSSSGTNVRMVQIEEHKWITQDMWDINAEWLDLSIKATLSTGLEFSATDPGADIEGWSKYVLGSSIKVEGQDRTVADGDKGYARIITDDSEHPNGNIEFLTINESRHIHYDNNGFLGTDIPDQYPTGASTFTRVQAPRIKAGYIFDGWTRNAAGTGTKYNPGDTINLSEGTTTLYAQASYDGTLQVAISFMEGGKRYFLTHPNSSAPRYARARHFDSWENTWQGMENAQNLDPNYVSTFEMRHPDKEIHKKDGDIADITAYENVLDPSHYTMKGYEDSLTFYEYFTPAKDEYLGLYYMAPNTIVANNTWAGLFTLKKAGETVNWPNYQNPYVPGVMMQSERYVQEYDPENKKDSLILKVRGNNASGTYVKYIPATNQFDGCVNPDTATVFDISAISVADAHYIVLPDTSEIWRDTITFGYHKNEQIRESLWSRLIGKQLMAVMRVGSDTVYFHPNRKKVINDPNNLYLSSDFRVTQEFTLIPDSRVSGSLSVGDSATMESTDHYWHRNIISGNSSPINVRYEGDYTDIFDTLRLTLSHGSISKIKEYRGRWNSKAPGITARKDGSSRYRDIIIRTKTYHYGATKTRLVLKPEQENYSLSALQGASQEISFTLTREIYKELMDAQNNLTGDEEIVDTQNITSGLGLTSGNCTFATGGASSTYFNVTAATSKVTVTTKNENSEGTDKDTMTVSYTYSDTLVTTSVFLTQTALSGSELVWSVEHNGTRYYIMAVYDGSTTTLQFRQFTRRGNTIYKQNSTTPLVKGSNAGDNNDGKYITPWKFSYPNKTTHPEQITLTTEYGINRYFVINASEGDLIATTPESSPSTLTYRFANVYTNDNANYEEKVRLKFVDQWLTFDGSKIVLQADSLTATIFSWSYLLPEYSLLNNGDYPSLSEAIFDYGDTSGKDIQTRYQAYREYSMLLDNTLTYLGREVEDNIKNLTDGSKEWKTYFSITRVADARAFDGGSKASGLTIPIDTATLTTTVTSTGDSPKDIKIGGKYVNIVDTLVVTIRDSLSQPYRFKGDWSDFRSTRDADLKIPLVRMTYHDGKFDSVVCVATRGQNSYTFPPEVEAKGGENYMFRLSTVRRAGTQVLDVDNNVVNVSDASSTYITSHVDDNNTGMHLNNPDSAEVRLVDEFGNTPAWCKITGKTDSTITVRCTKDGIRTPRSAYIYLAYIIRDNKELQFVNYRLTVSQSGKFSYNARQTLLHSYGASGDTLTADGRQQVHENKRIIYYYPDEDIDLPVRERGFYGWWRWYREKKDSAGTDVGDTDVPDTMWVKVPTNTGNGFNIPFRKIIVDSVMVDPGDETKGKKLGRTMGRYTVFHYKAIDYKNKLDPPAKTPIVAAPTREFGGKKPTLTYVADISNYYDNLPMSIKDKNQVDLEMMDTLSKIVEPTLSLREIFELRPWTEMADMLENYKYVEATDAGKKDGSTTYDSTYMEDHVLMAPLGNVLLLRTEQRYNRSRLEDDGLTESLLGYYTHDDNWKSWSVTRQDSMIWCVGYDQDYHWYTYTPKSDSYKECNYQIKTEDVLEIPAKNSLSAGHEFDTVYYCLRARSRKTATAGTVGDPDPVDIGAPNGDNWFNICRYMIIYHKTDKYGPKLEKKVKGVNKAIMTNDEIEQTYEVLEKLNFDYNKPGSEYTIYPRPLPWADASYGFMYPETPNLPHNRYHEESDFPNYGEYGLINRIPYDHYWRKMEQHGGAANGYMIYCDGMASAGQVAALHLETNLCAGQQMYFSGYVGNPAKNDGKADPNFTFSVQGSTDGEVWEDITEYTTGGIKAASEWRQIFFPINFNSEKKNYSHFRVRIFNVAANFDGNDFVIDDMRLFATKPPLIAYQAETKCVAMGDKDSTTQVVLRLDYQGFTDKGYNDKNVFYTVQKIKDEDTTYVSMTDAGGYLNQRVGGEGEPSIYGYIHTPAYDYTPSREDSIFSNLNRLIESVNKCNYANKTGFIYENVNGIIRPVMYVIHEAKMTPDNEYKVRMSLDPKQLNSSICAMTSNLKVTNKMLLELNGEERQDKEVTNLCANTTYDISMRVKGTLHLDSVAPIDLDGSCYNDWLVGGDTARASSKVRYGYYYSDIVKVVKEILRAEPMSGKNINQFAPNISSVSKNEMKRIMDADSVKLETKHHPYDVLDTLVMNGHLILYKSKLTETVGKDDSLVYVVLPIKGTGTDAVRKSNIDVCPEPVYIKLKSTKGGVNPMLIGGTTVGQTPVILTSSDGATSEMCIRIDSIWETKVKLDSIVTLRSTNDPNYLEGSHSLNLIPNNTRYNDGDTIRFRPARTNNYVMRPGYSYTFDITMLTLLGGYATWGEEEGNCPVGNVPFTVSVVPDHLRWDPQTKESNKWNNPDNWIGITQLNEPIHEDAHFAPLSSTSVVIPALGDTLPYPVIPATITSADSIHQTGFEYNKCNVIRFMPGAAMAQQQNLTCADAVIDMTLPNRKWALRAAPVEGLLTGDIYMSEADLNWETSPWEVGLFDATGRNYQTGNASFWFSLYNSRVTTRGKISNDTLAANAEWSQIANGLTLPLLPAKGFAVYARTASDKDAVVRLPKNDDIYYYYGAYGDKMEDYYEYNLRSLRNADSVANGLAGKLAFRLDPAGSKQTFTMKGKADNLFVFGNPTMGYIDIWGFLADNPAFKAEISYLEEIKDSPSEYKTVTDDAVTDKDTISALQRYLPPMHVLVLKLKDNATSAAQEVYLYANRIVTHPNQKVALSANRPVSPAPRRASNASVSKGIMTVIAINPASARCKSRLLLGQGFHAAILEGEDALLTTIDIDNFRSNTTPSTPFNIYAVENNCGLCVDLRDEILNVPLSFFMSELPFAPTTQLWFTGVNNIDGELVLYDALTNTEQRILDGICIDIETPEQSHEVRYYIRRRGFNPNDPTTPIATTVETNELEDIPVTKIIRDGHVLVLRNGHVYTMFGVKIK